MSEAIRLSEMAEKEQHNIKAAVLKREGSVARFKERAINIAVKTVEAASYLRYMPPVGIIFMLSGCKPEVTPDAEPPVTPDAEPPVTPDAEPPVTPDAEPPVTPPAAESNYTAEGTDLVDNRTGQPVFLRGIGYSPFFPGETPVWGGNLPNDNRYEGHLRTISELNSDFILFFPQFGPSNFFKALDNSGLNYAQDIYVDGWTNDLLNETFQQESIEHIKSVIDHTYSTGRPARLVFFSVGDEINAGTIYRTDTAHPSATSFNGNYISLSGRTPSEIAIAKLMDAAMTHEQQTYGMRHLYAHTSWTHIGPVADRPDLEVSGSSVFFPDFGDLICMNIYTYARGVVTSPPGSATGTPYQGYIEDLAAISDKPIVITQVGLSTSPFADPLIPGFGGNYYQEVSDTYRQIWQDVLTASGSEKVAGLSWFEFMDEWWKNGETGQEEYSQDPNDPEEWFGIYKVKNQTQLEPKGDIPATVRELYGQD